MSNKQFLVAIVAVAGLLCNMLLWLQIGTLYGQAIPDMVVTLGSIELFVLTIGAALGFATPLALAMVNPVVDKEK